MENLQLINFIIEGLGVVVMFFMKQWIDNEKIKNTAMQVQINNSEKEITNIRLNYVHKNDFADFKKELWTRFDRIEDMVSHNGELARQANKAS